MITRSRFSGQLIRVRFAVGWDDDLSWRLHRGYDPATYPDTKVFETREEAESYRGNSLLTVKEYQVAFKFQ